MSKSDNIKHDQELGGKMFYPNFSMSSLTQLKYSCQVNMWKNNQVEYLVINHVSSSRLVVVKSSIRHLGLITNWESDNY